MKRKNTDWSVSLDENVESKELVRIFFNECGLTPYNEETLDYSFFAQDSDDVMNNQYSGWECIKENHFTIPSQWHEAKAYICKEEKELWDEIVEEQKTHVDDVIKYILTLDNVMDDYVWFKENFKGKRIEFELNNCLIKIPYSEYFNMEEVKELINEQYKKHLEIGVNKKQIDFDFAKKTLQDYKGICK